MTTNKKELWLDSLRGIACLIVLFAHILAVSSKYSMYASGCGKIGVWLFMLLSGMLLVKPYINDSSSKFQPKDIFSFYYKKILKIFPAYIIGLIIIYTLRLIDISNLCDALLFRAAWGHFWYIPVIIKFYIIAPVFLLLCSKVDKRIFALITGCVAIALCFIFPFTRYIENSIALRWYLPVFIMGMLLEILINSIKSKSNFYIVGIVLAFLTMLAVTPLGRKIILGIAPSSYLQNKYLLMSFLWAIIILCISNSSMKNVLDKCKALQRIGKYSYEIYIIHFIVLSALTTYGMPYLVKVLITLIVTAVGSIILHFAVSKLIKHKLPAFIVIICIYCVLMIIAVALSQKAHSDNVSDEGNTVSTAEPSWKDYLYVPTYINKINNDYFIVDCWNHRIIYNSELNTDLSSWNTLIDTGFIGGHTICSDGELIVADNTDASQILVFSKQDNTYTLSQTFEGVTGRPHFITYDETNRLFYAISSIEGTINVFDNQNSYLHLVRSEVLPEIVGSYVRSISIIDGYLYTVSGPSFIYKYKINPESFEKVAEYKVPAALSGMNQITKINDMYYITVNTGETGSVAETTIVRASDLAKLSEGNYDNLYDKFGFVGQPYFISYFDDSYFITEISEEKGNGIKRFQVNGNDITEIETLFYYDAANDDSKTRYSSIEATKDTKEKVDIILFAGQSNMSGKGNASEAPVVEKGYEFRAITDPYKLNSIEEPFGLYENNPDGINDTWENMTILRKSGSMVSAFANSYYSYTGVPIVAVSCSEGATRIEDWLPGTPRYTDIFLRANATKDYLLSSEDYTLGNTYIVWCQGESDGDIGTDPALYKERLNSLFSTLISDHVVDHCFVIAIGKNGEAEHLYDKIREAQIEFCNENENGTLVSDNFYYMQDYMIDTYHFNQTAYNIVGNEAGKNAAIYTILWK